MSYRAYDLLLEIRNRRALFQRNAAWVAFFSGSEIHLLGVYNSREVAQSTT